MPVLRRLLTLTLTLALAWVCALSPAAVRAADPYDIYVLLPLSGYLSFYAGSQQQVYAAIESAVNKTGGIGGRPVHFVIDDDQSDPKVDVELFNQIAAKGVPVILGPTNTSQCNALMPLVKNGPVIYCFTPGPHPPPGGYTFAFGSTSNYVLSATMRYFHDRGIRRIAALVTNDATGQDGDLALASALAEHPDMQMVDEERFAPNDITVAAQIARIQPTNPQLLIVYTTGKAFGTALRSIKDAGMTIPVFSMNGNLTFAQMKQYADILPAELIFPGGPFHAPEQYTGAQREAIDTFNHAIAALGARPDWGHNNCWDPTMIVISALRKYGPGATAGQIQSYIANLQGYPGINGTYDFKLEPQRGLQRDATVMVRWDPARDNWVAVSRRGGAPLN
jgi:branched-chain amino acid transport system substrate-binding protein